MPIGYVWHRELGLNFDPDQRLQEVIRLIFARFREIGSARQVLGSPRSLCATEGIHSALALIEVHETLQHVQETIGSALFVC